VKKSMISEFSSNVSFSRIVHLLILFSSLSGLFASGVQAANLASPIPYVSAISSLTVVPGGQAFTVTVRGAKFVSQSVVSWGTTPLVTTFVSRGKLTALVLLPILALGLRSSLDPHRRGCCRLQWLWQFFLTHSFRCVHRHGDRNFRFAQQQHYREHHRSVDHLR
jgi:hypothetical protein